MYKRGDNVVVIKEYPDGGNPIYQVGETIKLMLCTNRDKEDSYWKTDRHTWCGIFESHFRKPTKLDKALK